MLSAPGFTSLSRSASADYQPDLALGFFFWTLAIIAPQGHPLGGARSITWKHLEGERWILPPSPSALESAVSNAFVSQGLVPPQAWIRSIAPATNLALVSAGLGLGAVPSPFARAARTFAPIEQIHVSPPAILHPVSLVYRAADSDSSSMRILQRAIDEALAEQTMVITPEQANHR